MTQPVSEAAPGTRETVELLAIAVKYNAVRCRRLTDGGIVTLRPAGGVREEAAGGDEGEGGGEGRRWREAVLQGLLRHPDVSPWERESVLAGPRPAYEMEQVVPGASWEEMIDPISDSVEPKEAGDRERTADYMPRCRGGLRTIRRDPRPTVDYTPRCRGGLRTMRRDPRPTADCTPRSRAHRGPCARSQSGGGGTATADTGWANRARRLLRAGAPPRAHGRSGCVRAEAPQ